MVARPAIDEMLTMRPRSVRSHRRQRETSQPHRRVDHRLEEGTSFLVADVLDCAGDPVARVVHEPVELEAAHHLLALLGIGDVEQHGLDLDSCRSRRLMDDVRLRHRSHRADRVEAPLREFDDGGEPDPRVRSGREDCLSGALSHGGHSEGSTTSTPAAFPSATRSSMMSSSRSHRSGTSSRQLTRPKSSVSR